jgi:hypothetical protein
MRCVLQHRCFFTRRAGILICRLLIFHCSRLSQCGVWQRQELKTRGTQGGVALHAVRVPRPRWALLHCCRSILKIWVVMLAVVDGLAADIRRCLEGLRYWGSDFPVNGHWLTGVFGQGSTNCGHATCTPVLQVQALSGSTEIQIAAPIPDLGNGEPTVSAMMHCSRPKEHCQSVAIRSQFSRPLNQIRQ